MAKKAKHIRIELNENEGLWHIVLVLSDGMEAEVATHCEKHEAEKAKTAIEQWATAS